MDSDPLDAVDRGILFHLQNDARTPITDIADAVNVSDNTVRNRIQALEDEGVIQGYSVDIDYDAAGVQHYYIFACTTRISEREELAAQARNHGSVVEVITLMTGTENVLVLGAAPRKNDISQVAHDLDDLGLSIDREHLVWSLERSAYDGFQLPETP